jgi:hypothetical protein
VSKNTVASAMRAHTSMEKEKVKLLGELGGWMMAQNKPASSLVVGDDESVTAVPASAAGSGEAQAQMRRNEAAIQAAQFVELATTAPPAELAAAISSGSRPAAAPSAAAATSERLDEIRVRDIESQMSQDVLASSLRSLRTRKNLRRILNLVKGSFVPPRTVERIIQENRDERDHFEQLSEELGTEVGRLKKRVRELLQVNAYLETQGHTLRVRLSDANATAKREQESMSTEIKTLRSTVSKLSRRRGGGGGGGSSGPSGTDDVAYTASVSARLRARRTKRGMTAADAEAVFVLADGDGSNGNAINGSNGKTSGSGTAGVRTFEDVLEAASSDDDDDDNGDDDGNATALVDPNDVDDARELGELTTARRRDRRREKLVSFFRGSDEVHLDADHVVLLPSPAIDPELRWFNSYNTAVLSAYLIEQTSRRDVVERTWTARMQRLQSDFGESQIRTFERHQADLDEARRQADNLRRMIPPAALSKITNRGGAAAGTPDKNNARLDMDPVLLLGEWLDARLFALSSELLFARGSPAFLSGSAGPDDPLLTHIAALQARVRVLRDRLKAVTKSYTSFIYAHDTFSPETLLKYALIGDEVKAVLFESAQVEAARETIARGVRDRELEALEQALSGSITPSGDGAAGDSSASPGPSGITRLVRVCCFLNFF